MSVVVVGLQHTQAPLPLLEAVAVARRDLHKVLRRAPPPPQPARRRWCSRPACAPRSTRWSTASTTRWPRSTRSSPSSPASRSRSSRPTPRSASTTTSPSHLFSVDLGPRVGGAGETEVVGQVRRAFERAPGGGRLRPGALGAVPPRAADGQAGADRDRRSPGDDLVRLRRGAPWPGATTAAACASERVVVVGAGEMGLGVCRALSDIPAPTRRAGRGGQPLAGAGRGPGARRPRRRPFACAPAPLDRVAAELAEADVVLTAVAAESHVLQRRRLRRRCPARCSWSTSACPATSTRRWRARPGSRCSTWTPERAGRAGPGRPRRGVGGRSGDRRRGGRALPHASRQRGAAPVIAALRARLESLRVPSSSATGPSWPT